MGALEGVEDFLLAIVLGLVLYVFIEVYQAMNLPGNLAQILVIAILVVIGGIGVKLFLRIYTLLYEEE